MIAGHLILPNLRLLAAFCESVEVTKDSENIYPKCEQNFANHNDDSSCVNDTNLPTIVGYQFEGEQICLNCIEEHLILNNLVFEIFKGDPDWGPGSVPICCKCGHEINTLPERPGEYCPSCNMKHTEACIDGGRCTGCGVMLTQVKPKDNMPITYKEAPMKPRYLYGELMKQLKGFEEIVQEESGAWTALLKNHKDVPDAFYDMSHGSLYIRVQPGGPEMFMAMLSVWSIDDGSIVLMGPAETEEKAEKRVLLLKAEAERWGGWIPTEAQVDETTTNTGCWWNR